ncbi:MAG: Gfo/Idh/MocA family oxidoreductase [Bacteroidales bacterium]|nr:Gfo/Idh/MocA family oxidoreductase [Bacteroidales bacterium]MBR5651344.1 Gfo/Idh/MocA family oxidoreductase [Bacteroidales bacterium]
MLKIGILGVGYLGKIHINCIRQIKDFELIGFYDINSDISEKVSKELNIKAFKDIDELIDSVDVIDIVTSTTSHFQCAVKSIEKGKHIFIEKPVVATYEEASKLQEIASHTNSKIQVGHVERFNPAFIAADKFIENPIFIEVHRLAPYNVRGADVPVTLDMMIHDIDILLHIVNSKIKHISACGLPIVSKTPDITNARIEFENGAAANLTASRLSLKKIRKCRIYQPNGYIIIDYLQQIAEMVSFTDNIDYKDPFAMIVNGVEGYDTPRQINFSKLDTIKNNAIETELRSFYNSIVTDSVPIVNLDDGLKAFNIAITINNLVENFIDNN